MGHTPRYQLPYVEAGDQQTQFPAQNKDAMEKIEAELAQFSTELTDGLTGTKAQAARAETAATRAENAATRAETAAAGLPRIEHGSKTVTVRAGTSNATGTTVTFSRPFTTPPTVVVSLNHAPGGSNRFVPRAYNITETGCQLAIYLGDQSAAPETVSIPIGWIAAGQ